MKLEFVYVLFPFINESYIPVSSYPNIETHIPYLCPIQIIHFI